VQGSSVGLTFYVVLESGLKPLSSVNLLCKFVDDTNLLVPAKSNIDIVQEFKHIKQWAMLNKMLINMSNTKEIVFRRPSIKHFFSPAPVSDVAQVSSAKLLGVILQSNLHFDEQITVILNMSAFLSPQNAERPRIVQEEYELCFCALILCKIRYALCAWGSYITEANKEQKCLLIPDASLWICECSL